MSVEKLASILVLLLKQRRQILQID